MNRAGQAVKIDKMQIEFNSNLIGEVLKESVFQVAAHQDLFLSLRKENLPHKRQVLPLQNSQFKKVPGLVNIINKNLARVAPSVASKELR